MTLKTIDGSGVYAIRNTITNRVYVGGTLSFRHRLIDHRHRLLHRKHYSKSLQTEWDRDGSEAFEWIVIEIVGPKPLRVSREQHWMDTLKSAHPDHGYNASPTAGSPKGIKRSEALRAKMSAVQKGRPHSAEHVANQAASARGKKRTPEQCARISAVKKGVKITPEQSAARKASGIYRLNSAAHWAKVRAAKAEVAKSSQLSSGQCDISQM